MLNDQHSQQEEEAQNLLQIEQNQTESFNNIVIKKEMSESQLYLNVVKMTIMWT